jgi:hypothetical protein
MLLQGKRWLLFIILLYLKKLIISSTKEPYYQKTFVQQQNFKLTKNVKENSLL